MAVTVAHDTASVPKGKSVGQEPFKRAPGGMDLHRGLEPWVVRIGGIGVPTTDVGVDNAVFVGEGLEKKAGVRCIGVEIRAIGQQGVGRSTYLPPFCPEKDVSIAANCSIA